MKSYGMIWGLVGCGLTFLGSAGSWILDDYGSSPVMEQRLPLSYVLFPAVGTGISVAVPLVIKQKPKAIPKNIPEDKHDCYVEGYSWEARRRSINGALVGSVVSGFFSFSVIFITLLDIGSWG